MKWLQRQRPPRLFKYKALWKPRTEGGRSPDFDPEVPASLASMLRDRLLYVPPMSAFNDPWEAMPAFVRPRGNVAAAMASLITIYNPEGGRSPWEPHVAKDYQREIDVVGVDEFLRRNQALFSRQFKAQRMYCVAEDPDIGLMWSYYADAHKGYVVEFDATSKPFSDAKPVTYSKKYPVFDVENAKKPLELFRRLMMVKAAHWKHEREWRVLAPRNSSVFDWHATYMQHGNGSIARLPKGCVRRIIIGAGAEPSTFSEISLLAAKADPPVPVVRCRLGSRAFRVVVPE